METKSVIILLLPFPASCVVLSDQTEHTCQRTCIKQRNAVWRRGSRFHVLFIRGFREKM